MESVSIGAQLPSLLCDLITSIQAQTNFFLSHRAGGREEKGAVIYLDQFPEALEIQTGSENHWRYLALRFANKEVILDDFPFLPCRAAALRHSKYYLRLPFL
ncbi:unnamed protein product [Prunus armeniaca]|uniref:Uncharacterized protein n=1 Tax=Prunus armeniaca TaxID=36596 RepID=A0A6J5TJH0_PRUAR|nr:unnamed protein product [Prunus armeniaca]CAB4263387.1 unnamed protein product [Prunus armeniaca]CAB4293899.1 unnamed protein product [Prunus armeniaca]